MPTDTRHPSSPEAARRNENEFVHLHLHSEYSLLDGGNRVDRLVARIKELGMTAVAVTDHGNIFGAVAVYEECKRQGIKPILGVEAYITPPGKPRTDRTYSGGGEGGYHLVLLAQDNTGWKNLMYLCTEAYLTGFYYKPRIDRELLESHSEGLIAINGHLGSEIGEHLLSFHRSRDEKHWEAALESARWHARVFNRARQREAGLLHNGKKAADDASEARSPLPRFYVELQHHVPEQNAINPLLIKLAREVGAPLVCDNDAHFLNARDHDSHDTLICISTARGKSDPDRMRYPKDLYVKSPSEMRSLFEPYGDAGHEALSNAAAIAARCNVELPVGANHAPAVRIDVPDAAILPRHDDPKYAGDLTAWYKDYCSKFELKPFQTEPTASDLASAKAECDAALRMLAGAGFIWRYGAPRGGGVSGGTVLRTVSGTNDPPLASDPRATITPAASPDADRAAKKARLDRELTILCDKGIAAYFLIVWDFVNWGRQRGIPATARGSGVGTMVGFALGLSNACPIKYGLLFERFTDPDRSEYPDIDIDLCQDGRADVINYVRAKYGHVAQIITFGTMKARAAIRDVGRALEVPLGEVDRIAKLVPETLGITIQEALDQEPELKKLCESDPRYRQLIEHAIQLEGHTRHAGVHAAGVIIATRPLHEIVPLYKPPKSEKSDKGEDAEIGETITQWDGPTCEKMGLLKMDFLGLRTLSIIERAKKLIREGMSEREIWRAVGRTAPAASPSTHGDSAASQTPPPHPLDLDRLTYDDPIVFQMFQRGETTGIFQFESGGMRKLLVEMKPDRLEDLIAANALFRPGPMDLIPDYNRRKHGQEAVPSVHEIVDTHTAETYGVMVYQEQVMQIVHGLGGIRLRDAYTLIKNISKKKHDKIEKERPKFIEGAVRQGLTTESANNLFELILKFAGYGFNKSHSAGYAIIAYQTAYLKTYFPNQYMAAFLTYESQANKASDWIPYLEDCRRTRFTDPATGKHIKTGVEVRPPDINLSGADFTVVYEERSGAHGASDASGAPPRAHAGHVRFGLKAIKGSGDKAVDAIIAERTRGGPFVSLFDFAERIPTSLVNKATIESLIKAGVFDSIHGRNARAAMLATVEQAISAGAKLAADRAAGQGGLFMGGGETTPEPTARAEIPLARAAPWSEAETLATEKETLGFYVSSHPLDSWKSWHQAFATSNCAGMKELKQDARVVLAAMVQSVRSIVVKNGKSAGQKMAILTVEDTSGACDCVLFTEAYQKFGHLAAAEKVLFVLGRADLARGEPQVIVDRLVPIDGIPLDSGKLQLFVDERRLNGNGIAAITRIADVVRSVAQNASKKAADEEAPVAFPVELVIGTESQLALVRADASIRVAPRPEFLKSIEAELGEGMVKIVGGIAVERTENGRGNWKRRSEE